MIPRCPLISAETAAAISGLNRKAILEMIEAGELLYAWDISTAPDSHNPCIRILSACLLDWTLKRPATFREDQATAMLASLFPVNFNPRAQEVARVMACSPDQVHRLLTVGELAKVRGTPCRRGRGGSPSIERGSLCRFLEKRRML